MIAPNPALSVTVEGATAGVQSRRTTAPGASDGAANVQPGPPDTLTVRSEQFVA